MALFLGGSHVSPAFGDAINVNVHNQSKTITPTKSVQTLVPDPGYTGMSQVTVQSIPSNYVTFSDTLSQFRKYIIYGSWSNWYSTSEIVDSGITSIGIGKMANVSPTLRTLNLPNCTTISAYGLHYNSQLTTISLPNLTTLEGPSIFAFCRALTNIDLLKLNLKNKTKAEYAFASCYNLTNVNFGSQTTSICNYMFYNCSSLNSVIANNVTTIGSYAFYSCKSLIYLSFPELSFIEDPGIFNTCGIESFTDVNFPKLNSINNTAYRLLAYCSNLSIISFNNIINMTVNQGYVGSSSFIFDYFQKNLKTIYFKSISTFNYPAMFNFQTGSFSIDLFDIGFVSYKAISEGMIYFGQSSLTSNHYINTVRIRNAGINSNFFQYVSYIHNVDLPDTKSIRDYTFMSAKNLLTISIPSVSWIGLKAFLSCYSLNYVFLPICNMISQEAFEECSMLTSIDLPLVQSISWGAFSSCINLTSINMPIIKTIEAYAFYNTPITSLSLNSCYNIQISAFTGMSQLEKLYINYPSSGTFSGNVFGNTTTSLSYTYPLSIISGQCYNLSSFSGSWFNTYLPNLKTISLNCYSVNQYTFQSNTILENLYLNGISNYSNSSFGLTIGIRAFQNCTNLTNLSLNNIRYIDTYAFANIKASNVYMHTASTFTYLNQYLFSGCSNLNTITISGAMSGGARLLTGTFDNIPQLYSLTLNLPSVIELRNTFSNVFNNTPYYSNTSYWSGPDPHIYVPASLVDAYKSAQYWSEGASYITAII